MCPELGAGASRDQGWFDLEMAIADAAIHAPDCQATYLHTSLIRPTLSSYDTTWNIPTSSGLTIMICVLRTFRRKELVGTSNSSARRLFRCRLKQEDILGARLEENIAPLLRSGTVHVIDG